MGGQQGGERASETVVKVLPFQVCTALNTSTAARKCPPGSTREMRNAVETKKIDREKGTGNADSMKIAPQKDELDKLKSILDKFIRHLSRQIHQLANQVDELRGAGATVAACLVLDNTALIAHMGDSRAYLMRDGILEQLTCDHSVIDLLLRLKRITENEAKKHPAQHAITRYVGMKDDVGPEIQELELKAGDRILLCSDGLTNMVKDKDIG